MVRLLAKLVEILGLNLELVQSAGEKVRDGYLGERGSDVVDEGVFFGAAAVAESV